jgi:hypothetical protein
MCLAAVTHDREQSAAGGFVVQLSPTIILSRPRSVFAFAHLTLRGSEHHLSAQGAARPCVDYTPD